MGALQSRDRRTRHAAVRPQSTVLATWHALCHETTDPRCHALGRELEAYALPGAVRAHMGGPPSFGPGMPPAYRDWIAYHRARHALCAMKRGASGGDEKKEDDVASKRHKDDAWVVWAEAEARFGQADATVRREYTRRKQFVTVLLLSDMPMYDEVFPAHPTPVAITPVEMFVVPPTSIAITPQDVYRVFGLSHNAGMDREFTGRVDAAAGLDAPPAIGVAVVVSRAVGLAGATQLTADLCGIALTFAAVMRRKLAATARAIPIAIAVEKMRRGWQGKVLAVEAGLNRLVDDYLMWPAPVQSFVERTSLAGAISRERLHAFEAAIQESSRSASSALDAAHVPKDISGARSGTFRLELVPDARAGRAQDSPWVTAHDPNTGAGSSALARVWKRFDEIQCDRLRKFAAETHTALDTLLEAWAATVAANDQLPVDERVDTVAVDPLLGGVREARTLLRDFGNSLAELADATKSPFTAADTAALRAATVDIDWHNGGTVSPSYAAAAIAAANDEMASLFVLDVMWEQLAPSLRTATDYDGFKLFVNNVAVLATGLSPGDHIASVHQLLAQADAVPPWTWSAQANARGDGNTQYNRMILARRMLPADPWRRWVHAVLHEGVSMIGTTYASILELVQHVMSKLDDMGEYAVSRHGGAAARAARRADLVRSLWVTAADGVNREDYGTEATLNYFGMLHEAPAEVRVATLSWDATADLLRDVAAPPTDRRAKATAGAVRQLGLGATVAGAPINVWNQFENGVLRSADLHRWPNTKLANLTILKNHVARIARDGIVPPGQVSLAEFLLTRDWRPQTKVKASIHASVWGMAREPERIATVAYALGPTGLAKLVTHQMLGHANVPIRHALLEYPIDLPTWRAAADAFALDADNGGVRLPTQIYLGTWLDHAHTLADAKAMVAMFAAAKFNDLSASNEGLPQESINRKLADFHSTSLADALAGMDLGEWYALDAKRLAKNAVNPLAFVARGAPTFTASVRRWFGGPDNAAWRGLIEAFVQSTGMLDELNL